MIRREGPLSVTLYDADGNPVVISGGTVSTQYNRDTPAGAADVLTMAGVVRKDAAGSLVDADGDRTGLIVDANGRLYVALPAGSGGLTDAELRATPVLVAYPDDIVAPAGTDTASALTVQGTGLGGVPLDVAVVSSGLQQTQIFDSILNSIMSKNATPSGTEWALVTRNIPSGTQPVSGPLTDAELRSLPIDVTLGVMPIGQTTMANSLPVVIASNQSAVPVTGPLTDTQLRATAVPVSGPLTDGQLRASAVPVSGPLTDGQLRATAVPVSGTFFQGTQPVSGTVTANQGTPTDWRVDSRRGQTILFAVIDASGAGDNTIVAADASKKVKVLSYVAVADAAVTARWKSGAGTNLSGAMSLAANAGAVCPPIAPGDGHYMETAVNQALVLNLGSAVGVRGHMSYILEA